MGIHGLSTFVEANDYLFTHSHRLSKTHLVVDGHNLLRILAETSRAGTRHDLFGFDMVAFSSKLNQFYDALEACEIVPIIVMDGAQNHQANKSKFKSKYDKFKSRFRVAKKISEQGIGVFICPPLAHAVFKSISIDRGIRIHQSFYEADPDIARLACELKCPVLSNDSDFYLFDIPHGLISIDNFHWLNMKKDNRRPEMEDNWRNPKAMNEHNRPELFIRCKLYRRENFKNYLPNLDTDCLPLLGPLLGNDYVGTGTYSSICSKLPYKLCMEFPNPYMCRKLIQTSVQGKKLIKVLCFCCDKTLPQIINQLSMSLPTDERTNFKKEIKLSLSPYCEFMEDTFLRELKKIFQDGYDRTYGKGISRPELEALFDNAIQSLADWLINCFEKAVTTQTILELLSANTIFLTPTIDDSSLPSSHRCRYRVYSVIMRLLRSHAASKKPVEIYDRVGSTFEKTLLNQIHKLDEYGPIKYLAFDIPKLSFDERRNLVLATFHYNHDSFVKGLLECDSWFDPENGDEFMTVNMLLDYVNIENPDAKLWKEFKRATRLCLAFYLCVLKPDDNLKNRLRRENNIEFLECFKRLVKSRSLCKEPRLGMSRFFGNRKYNSRIVHQISQLNNTIEAFNLINALLGEPLTRIRAERWLNSCLIYNLTEALRDSLIKNTEIPGIIIDGSTYYSPMRTKDARSADKC